ncbi:MAG: mechanosensitive ion channel family protein [Verrucomicrobia bacterium]|nr:mechanosensitive ion channel family protein [Verrucomicrobiota bacterium]
MKRDALRWVRRCAAAAPLAAIRLGAAQPARLDPAAPGIEAAGAPSAPAVSSVWIFGLDRVSWLSYELLGNPLYRWLASACYILLAFYLAKLVDRIARRWLERWAARTRTSLDDLLIQLLAGPVKVVCFVVLLHIGLNLFTWPEWINRYLSMGLKLVVAGSLTYVTLKLVDVLLDFWQRRSVAASDRLFADHLFPVIRRSLKGFIVVVAVLLTTQNLGMNITSLLASLSIGGLAVGLAAQDTLSNLFGAVAVYLDKPFQIGDRIRLENVDGVVEGIGLRSTRVRNLDGHLITVPNKTMGSAIIVNITRRPNIRIIQEIGITYDTPAERVKMAQQILAEVYRGHPMTHDVWITFNRFADSSLNFEVVYWWKNTDYKAFLDALGEMNLAIKDRFDRAAISFAFPTRTLYVKQDSEWKVDRGVNTGGPPGVHSVG